MKIFLSWSGQTSHQIAKGLREWLQSVIQTAEPWLSSEDIKKGARWSPAIAKELAESRAAIFCLTPENLQSPWLNFEAGAVSNTPWSANVCTYLFGISNSDVTGPLTQFQSTIATSKEDNLRLLSTINSAQEGRALDPKRLDKAFNTFWPELEAVLTTVPKLKEPSEAKRSPEDIAKETLGIVRDLRKQFLQFSASAVNSRIANESVANWMRRQQEWENERSLLAGALETLRAEAKSAIPKSSEKLPALTASAAARVREKAKEILKG